MVQSEPIVPRYVADSVGLSLSDFEQEPALLVNEQGKLWEKRTNGIQAIGATK